jgi:hypothetical protein
MNSLRLYSRFSKKAITPLVSTILLLVFAVFLGTLVMSWGNNASYQSGSGCKDTKIAVTTLEDRQQLCLKEGNIKAILENNGADAIDSLRIIALTDHTVIADQHAVSIPPGQYKHLDLPIDIQRASKILKIRIVPINDKECISSNIEIENIGVCE